MGPSSKLPTDHQTYRVPLCELVSSSATVRLSSIGALVGRGGWLGLAACEDLPPLVAAGHWRVGWSSLAVYCVTWGAQGCCQPSGEWVSPYC